MLVCVGETDRLPPDEGETDVEFADGMKSLKYGEYKEVPIVVGGTVPTCHEICIEAFEVPDQMRFALVPLTMVVLFDESDGIQTGAGVRPPKEPQKKPMHILPDDPDEEDGAGTVIVLEAVAVFPPPEHVTV